MLSERYEQEQADKAAYRRFVEQTDERAFDRDKDVPVHLETPDERAARRHEEGLDRDPR